MQTCSGRFLIAPQSLLFECPVIGTAVDEGVSRDKGDRLIQMDVQKADGIVTEARMERNGRVLALTVGRSVVGAARTLVRAPTLSTKTRHQMLIVKVWVLLWQRSPWMLATLEAVPS